MPTNPPLERLLLATEHTDFDCGAERVGFALCEALGVPLSVVLPVTSNPESEEADPAYAARLDAQVADAATRLRATARDAGVDVVVRVRRSEEPALAILAEATERAADLIVIRRRGRRGFLARLLVGETVRSVVARAPCSTLLVPRACAIWQRRVLAVIDAGPASSGVVAAGISLARAAGLPLTVASAASARPAEVEALSLATAMARAQGVDVEHRVVGTPLAEGIAGLAGSVGADLVVLARDDAASGTSHPFGALARAVVGLAQWPVLLIRDGNRS